MVNSAKLYKIVILIIFAFSFSLAIAIPEAKIINWTIEKNQEQYQKFIQQSFIIRMAAEYKGKFLSEQDKEQLLSLARETSKRLSQLQNKQQRLKQEIEDYEADDWEEKFGENKLFRKLINNIFQTELNKLKVDLWQAFACDGYDRNLIFKKILKNIESCDRPPAAVDLIKAKIYASLAKVDAAYFDEAKKQLSRLMIRSDISQKTAVESSIEYYKLTYQEPEHGDDIVNYQLPGHLSNDLEFMLPVVFLQRKLEVGYNRAAILIEIIQQTMGKEKKSYKRLLSKNKKRFRYVK